MRTLVLKLCLLLTACAWAQASWLDWQVVQGPHYSGPIRQAQFQAGPIGSLTVRVLLPPGYSPTPTHRYPVLYTCDGENVFQPGAFGDWRMDETAQLLMLHHQIPDLLIVSVNSPAERLRYYTSRRAWNEDAQPPQLEGGDAELYLQALHELKTRIDQDFPTDPKDAGLIGSSLGGLFALYAGYARPDEFPRLIAMSPSLWWAGQPGTGDLVPMTQPPRGPRRVWLDMGDNESASTDPIVHRVHAEDNVAYARNMGAWLSSLHTSEVKLVIVPGAAHHEDYWAARLGDALRWLYRPGL